LNPARDTQIFVGNILDRSKTNSGHIIDGEGEWQTELFFFCCRARQLMGGLRDAEHFSAMEANQGSEVGNDACASCMAISVASFSCFRINRVHQFNHNPSAIFLGNQHRRYFLSAVVVAKSDTLRVESRFFFMSYIFWFQICIKNSRPNSYLIQEMTKLSELEWTKNR